MTVNSATPGDTLDHAFGSGATSYSWWTATHYLNFTVDQWVAGTAPDDWEVELTAENPDGPGTVSKVVTHKTFMAAARRIVAGNPKLNKVNTDACRDLIFDADEADIDASIGDCILQVAMFNDTPYA